MDIRCVSYNIQYGLGADGNYDLRRVASEVNGADIIALQEVDRFWKRSSMLDSPQVLSEHLPGYYWIYGPFFDMDASIYKDGVVLNRRKQFGLMLLSRWPIISSRCYLLPKSGKGDHNSIQEGFLEGVIDTGKGIFRVYCVHLSHFSSSTRMPQVSYLMDCIEKAPGQGGVWCGVHPNPKKGWVEEDEPPMPSSFILMGDMNFAYSSLEYAKMIGSKKADGRRLYGEFGFYDAWVSAGNSEESGLTCPDDASRIDHCFVSQDLSSKVKSVYVNDKAVGSDHYPVWLEFAM